MPKIYFHAIVTSNGVFSSYILDFPKEFCYLHCTTQSCLLVFEDLVVPCDLQTCRHSSSCISSCCQQLLFQLQLCISVVINSLQQPHKEPLNPRSPVIICFFATKAFTNIIPYHGMFCVSLNLLTGICNTFVFSIRLIPTRLFISFILNILGV